MVDPAIGFDSVTGVTASLAEIEIIPEMIEAGKREIASIWLDFTSPVEGPKPDPVRRIGTIKGSDTDANLCSGSWAFAFVTGNGFFEVVLS